MIKDPMLILSEAMHLDTNQDSGEDDPLLKEIQEIEELDEAVLYTEEMIPVFKTQDRYVVEYDLLQKLIESKVSIGEYCDEEKALKLLEECNGISDVYILIESENSIKSNLEALKKQLKIEKNPKNRAIIQKRIDDTNKKIKSLKEKIIKKKSEE